MPVIAGFATCFILLPPNSPWEKCSYQPRCIPLLHLLLLASREDPLSTKESFTIDINQFAPNIYQRTSPQNFLPIPRQMRGERRQTRSQKNIPGTCECVKLWGMGTSMVTLCINTTKQLEVAALLARPMNKVSL